MVTLYTLPTVLIFPVTVKLPVTVNGPCEVVSTPVVPKLVNPAIVVILFCVAVEIVPVIVDALKEDAVNAPVLTVEVVVITGPVV